MFLSRIRCVTFVAELTFSSTEHHVTSAAHWKTWLISLHYCVDIDINTRNCKGSKHSPLGTELLIMLAATFVLEISTLWDLFVKNSSVLIYQICLRHYSMDTFVKSPSRSLSAFLFPQCSAGLYETGGTGVKGRTTQLYTRTVLGCLDWWIVAMLEQLDIFFFNRCSHLYAEEFR